MTMNTIVLNTLTGAVSEYSGFAFDSITPTHAGSATGLYELGGDTDATAPIEARAVTGKTDWKTAFKKYVDVVFLALKGAGRGRCLVVGENTSHGYNFPIRRDGESRCQPGRGIRENYLAFGFENLEGADFQLDRIEVRLGQSGTRRTQ
jgi:hypothetical protein